MNKQIHLILVLLVLMALPFTPVSAQEPVEQAPYTPSPENEKSRAVFNNHRLGVFIHFGIYSMLADGEWVMEQQGINRDEYSHLAGGFYPSGFNAAEWVSTIKQSGAKYICLTARHHDGFPIFDTKYSEYDVVDATPFKRDIIKEIAEECQKQGLALHFYYSLLDWYREDYPLGKSGTKNGRVMKEDWDSYYQFMRNQVTELLTNYGPIGAIWFDGWWDQRHHKDFDWQLPELYDMIHDIQPGCLIANNHHQIPYPGEDIQTFEHHVPGENLDFYSAPGISSVPLETTTNMNKSWGYSINSKDYRSAEFLIQFLIKSAGANANFLVNIGPRPDGRFPIEGEERLKRMGEWLEAYGETIYGTTGGIVPPQDWGVTTQKGNTLYTHVLSAKNRYIFLPLSDGEIAQARTFKGSKPIAFTQTKQGVILDLKDAPEILDFVIELTLKP
ncbi:MAG: alpha-L-fucosidase [Sphingobacterium sp.]